MIRSKANAKSKKLAITLREVLNVYLATKELRPSTIYVYRRIIPDVFTDWLDKPITSITKDQVEERHRKLTSTPRRQGHSGRAYANGAFKTLQALIDFANEKYEVDGQPLLRSKSCQQVNEDKGVVSSAPANWRCSRTQISGPGTKLSMLSRTQTFEITSCC